jgi:hypothetical protein
MTPDVESRIEEVRRRDSTAVKLANRQVEMNEKEW